MKLSIYQAGRLTGVHRATLHRWLKKGVLTREKDTNLVDTDEIIALRARQTKGRVAGLAYKTVKMSGVGDLVITLERSIVMLVGVMKAMPKGQHAWVKKLILEKIDDPQVMEVVVESLAAAKVAVIESEQAKLWNEVIYEASLSPKVDVQWPAIRALGEEIMRRELARKAGTTSLEDQSTTPEAGANHGGVLAGPVPAIEAASPN